MKRLLFVLLGLFSLSANAQEGEQILLDDMKVQIEATQAVNDLYNFKFEKAQQQFRWLKQKYGWHPLPYFLLGLSEWWKILPNMRDTSHDARFLAYMDTTISISERLIKIKNHKVESAFFLSAAYAFKGRLYSDEERRNWRKAASAGKSALNYLETSKGKHGLSPELLLGDALYNYFSVWIPENYPYLKPILLFFPKGDKDLGMKQLREVANNAFYTRTEAQVFLMKILGSHEKDKAGALQIAEYLYTTFPGNAYFHRYYARFLYSSGMYSKVLPVAKNILDKIAKNTVGYEATSGRYAAFFAGQVYDSRGMTYEAIEHYELCMQFAEEIGAVETGYYLYAMLYAGRLYGNSGKHAKAREYYKKIRANSKKSHSANKQARNLMRAQKKLR